MAKLPGSGTLADHLNRIHRRLDELTRRGPAAEVCRLHLAANVSMPRAANVTVTNWAVAVDNREMWNGTNPVAPHAGRYFVRLHLQFAQAVAGSDAIGYIPGAVAGKIMANGANPGTDAIGSTSLPQAVYKSGDPAGEGTAFDVLADSYLNHGDVLHFGVWGRYATTLQTTGSGVLTPTGVTVVYLGPE